MTQSSENALSRRKALAGVGVAGAAAVAATVLPTAGTPVQAVATAVPEPTGLDASGGYRMTEHIQRYYDTTRA